MYSDLIGTPDPQISDKQSSLLKMQTLYIFITQTTKKLSEFKVEMVYVVNYIAEPKFKSAYIFISNAIYEYVWPSHFSLPELASLDYRSVGLLDNNIKLLKSQKQDIIYNKEALPT